MLKFWWDYPPTHAPRLSIPGSSWDTSGHIRQKECQLSWPTLVAYSVCQQAWHHRPNGLVHMAYPHPVCVMVYTNWSTPRSRPLSPMSGHGVHSLAYASTCASNCRHDDKWGGQLYVYPTRIHNPTVRLPISHPTHAHARTYARGYLRTRAHTRVRERS